MAQTYTATTIKDLNASNPPEGSTDVPELNDSDREVKLVLKNQYAITTITTPTTLTSAHSVIVFGATTTATLPTASTVASSTYTKQYHFINPVGSGFTGTITGTVSGVVNPTLAAGENMIVYTDGTSWFMHSPKYVTADTALRTHSATPAANTIPVSDSTKGLLFGHSDGTNHIKTKIIDIGDWNMDTTDTVLITHGMTLAKIRAVSATIRNDADTSYQPCTTGRVATVNEIECYIHTISSTTISLSRRGTGVFDSTDYDSTSYNRGWITITYVE
jgi:hypothetical protein